MTKSKRHREAKPLLGRSKQAGRIVRTGTIFSRPIVPPVLHEDKVTHVLHGSGAALGFCRELVLHLAAKQPYGSIRPSRALRIMVATVRETDARDEFTKLIEATGILPANPIHIHGLEFDWDELRQSTELARKIRVTGADVLLAECGRPALTVVRKHLGDLSLPILTPGEPPADVGDSIVLRLHDDKTFQVIEGDAYGR